jgi:hypothetical protein
LVDAAIIQLGEILGMVYDPACNDCYNVMNPNHAANAWVNGYPELQHYMALGGAENLPHGDCSKCQFKKLYCEDEPCCSIHDYASDNQNLYPNPGEHNVTIAFTLPISTEKLNLYINDVLGQTVIAPIKNGQYEAGEQTINLNIESLPNGVYYVIIEAGTHRTAQPLTIAR